MTRAQADRASRALERMNVIVVTVQAPPDSEANPSGVTDWHLTLPAQPLDVRPVVLQLALAGFDVKHDVPMADVAADAEEVPDKPVYPHRCPVCWLMRADVEDVSLGGYLNRCPNCGSPAVPVQFDPLRG